jgi:hypothetical protein
MLTENAIELAAEKAMDQLDKALLEGVISQECYEENIRILCRNVSMAYHQLRQHQLAVN